MREGVRDSRSTVNAVPLSITLKGILGLNLLTNYPWKLPTYGLVSLMANSFGYIL
jgi:hypothetical protein